MDFIDGNERRRFAALLIASLFALSGCTDDDDAGDGTSPLAGHWTGSATDAKVPEFMEDLTAPEEFTKAREATANASGFRRKGAGRPTKRDRRILQSFFE